MSKNHLIHLVSHPVQYYTPLYARIAADKDIDFLVLYCSKKGLEKTHDVEFGVSVQWDLPLLDGYAYKFLKNHAWHESLDHLMGLFNCGIIKEIAAAPKQSVIWIHGWNYATHLLAVFVGKLYGHRVFMRGDNTAVIEMKEPNTLKKRFKKLWFSRCFFPLIDKFLAVGNQNKAFFQLFGVPDHKIEMALHCIDNQRFIQQSGILKSQKKGLREALGIPLSKTVLIISGKYIEKKRPLDLLRAMTLLPKDADVFAIFVGEGKLRAEMEQFICEHHLTDKVLLTGFINQSLMPNYYAVSDIYVMCSGMWETWGLSTNEALCFGLPVILSDMVGSAYDLIDGNGFMYPSGDVQALAQYLQYFLLLPEKEFQTKRDNSRCLIERYQYENVVSAIKSAVINPHNN